MPLSLGFCSPEPEHSRRSQPAPSGRLLMQHKRQTQYGQTDERVSHHQNDQRQFAPPDVAARGETALRDQMSQPNAGHVTDQDQYYLDVPRLTHVQRSGLGG